MTPARSTPASRPAYRAGAFSLFVATAVILAALGFEHIGGYEPCQLCLQQRYAYYAAIPALFGILVLVSIERFKIAAGLFFLVCLAFLANAGLGVYHAGVEWQFWEGPASCSAAATKPLATTASGLLKSLATKTIASCGEAQIRFLGLSCAGWTVIASLILAFATLKAAFLSSNLR